MLETYNHDEVTSGSDAISTTTVTILSGQVLAKNEPIGQVTASGKFTACVRTASNGSETPVYITPVAIDATGGDVKAQVYKAGTFDPDLLEWDATHNTASKLTAFVGTPISLQSPANAL